MGVVLAKLTGLRFCDTDLEIQVREHATLQAILEQRGYHYLRSVEEQVILEVDLENAIVSTGGSAVYSGASMSPRHHCVVLPVKAPGVLPRFTRSAPLSIAITRI